MVVSFSLTSSHSPGKMRKHKHPRKPDNLITHRAKCPERGNTMSRKNEVEEILENIKLMSSDESIHHLLIVSRALLQIEKEKSGD